MFHGLNDRKERPFFDRLINFENKVRYVMQKYENFDTLDNFSDKEQVQEERERKRKKYSWKIDIQS